MVKVSLDLHDFSVANNRLDLLWKFKGYFPNFKVSLFTVPFDIKNEKGQKDRKETLRKIHDCLGWIQIIPHGLTHNSSEARHWDYDHFINTVVPSIKVNFERDELPFVEGFCAPHWDWNKDVVRALDDLGWWGAITPKRKMLSTKKFYQYTDTIDNIVMKDVIKLHGHLNGTSFDDLEKNFLNVYNLPKDVEWHFITDFIE